ncbi:hypothetical protein GCM10010869_47270 [Mesorhizobium tianshanense]|nr:hypothetical protein GCM10010869_47270 [Mesorhizobium tianshanense]
MFEAALSSSSTAQLANRPAFEKASVGAYAASAKQSIAKIARAVQSFLSVSSWRKSAGGKCQQIDALLRKPSLLIMHEAVCALESLIAKATDGLRRDDGPDHRAGWR